MYSLLMSFLVTIFTIFSLGASLPLSNNTTAGSNDLARDSIVIRDTDSLAQWVWHYHEGPDPWPAQCFAGTGFQHYYIQSLAQSFCIKIKDWAFTNEGFQGIWSGVKTIWTIQESDIPPGIDPANVPNNTYIEVGVAPGAIGADSCNVRLGINVCMESFNNPIDGCNTNAYDGKSGGQYGNYGSGLSAQNFWGNDCLFYTINPNYATPGVDNHWYGRSDSQWISMANSWTDIGG